MELNLPMTAEELAAERRMLESLPPSNPIRKGSENDPGHEGKRKAPSEPAKPNNK